jgi:hypothetical protein
MDVWQHIKGINTPYSAVCRMSNPCLHDVIITYDGGTEEVKEILRGDIIGKIYEKLDLPVPPHFKAQLNSSWIICSACKVRNPIKTTSCEVCGIDHRSFIFPAIVAGKF